MIGLSELRQAGAKRTITPERFTVDHLVRREIV
jgi:hypothetical protein